MQLNIQKTGAGPLTIVCLHGLGGTLHDFDLLVDHLEKYSFWQVDLRGFGQSDKPLSPHYNTALWANDLHHLIDQKVILLGHSMGARVATHFASLYPEKVAGLINLGITVWGSNPLAQAKLLQVADQIEAHGMEKIERLIPSFSDPQIKERVRNTLLANDPKPFALALRSVASDYGEKKAATFYKAITCPTLTLLGDRDTAPFQGALELTRQLSHAYLGMIPDCGHYSILEKPHLVAALIHDFLAQMTL